MTLDVITDDGPVSDEDVLPKAAVAAEDGSGADVHPVPDTGAGSDPGAFIDDGRCMGHVSVALVHVAFRCG
jgi:hypothetical protein